MTTYYQSEQNLKNRFDALSRGLGFKARSRGEYDIWRRDLRAKLRELLGIDHMLPCDLNPRVTEIVQEDGYRRERIEIDTEPGVSMPFYALVPDNLTAPAPPVIAAHGHDSGGKLTPAGIVGVPGIAERVKQYDYNYGQVAARRGYVVFCPDARGFGERRESCSQGDDKLFNSSCHQLAHMALPLGLTVAGMWAFDLMRLLDYIATRPECQGQPAGCIGLSGGGLQTLWLTALDDRVACAVVSGYFYGVKDSLLELSDNCDCNYVPHLWETADMGDIGALIAPRPLLIETGTIDDLNGTRGVPNVMEQYAITEKAYELLGCRERLDMDLFVGPHKWNGVKAMPWLDRWLKS
jgi:dienelactone hydrolase